MSWSDEVEELARRRERARRMGGEERVAKQHAAGKLTANVPDGGSPVDLSGVSRQTSGVLEAFLSDTLPARDQGAPVSGRPSHK